jgi:hypothetical protein
MIPPRGPFAFIPHKGRKVYRDDTRNYLAHGIVIHHFFDRYPAFLFDELPFHYGDHRIAAAEGHTAHF